jgi:pimeloyl-ACP methyl ester carboxylesterase
VKYIYLHGFASSPQSLKAQYLKQKFQELNRDLIIPDLNQDDFSHLTLTRQIEQVSGYFASEPTPVTLIGSSLGGLTAAWLGETYPQIQQLILLAPAFGFLPRWLAKLGETELQKWQETDYLSVYHYGVTHDLPLHYQFVTDASQYSEDQLKRSLPTFIFHGKRDDVVPIIYSRHYQENRSWVRLKELDDDHSLTTSIVTIWQEIKDYFPLTG